MKFAVLTIDEAAGADIAWGADVDLAAIPAESLPCEAGMEADQRGRLRRPFVVGAGDNPMTFRPGAIVLAGDYGLHLFEC
jgi:hypothetical protein